MNQNEGKRKRFTIIGNILWLINLLVLTGLLGEHGVGYLAGPLEIFYLLILLTSYTMPEAVARAVRVRIQKGQQKNSVKVFHAAMVLCVVYSVVGSLCLFLGAEFFVVKVTGCSYAAFTLKLFIPAYVLYTFSQAFRGLFQGMGSMVPTGISNILGKIILIASGVIFAMLFRGYGEKVSALLVNEEFTASYAGAGVAVGFGIAMLFSLLFLFFVYQTNKRSFRNTSKETSRIQEHMGELIMLVLTAMLPNLFSAFLLRVPVLAGMAFYNALAGIEQTVAVGVQGAFYGKFFAITALLIMLIRLLCVSLEGNVAAALRKEEQKNGRERLAWGAHYIFIAAGFLTVAIAVLGKTLVAGLFTLNTGQAGAMFSYGCVMILFACAALYFMDILSSCGKKKMLLGGIVAATGIFFVTTFVAVKLLKLGMLGAILGLDMFWLVLMAISGFICWRYLKWSLDWIYHVVMPIGTAALSGVIMMMLNKALVGLVGNLFSFIICFVIGALGNFVMLLALKNIGEMELKTFPLGAMTLRLAKTLRLL